jgi:colanic acid biosynthesis glycosyl transferase WcaI
MNVLLLNQFFWPDSAATSQLLTDVSRGLADRGHEVYVICADGNYALQDEGAPPSAIVHRVKSVPFVRGSLGRILSYASFFLSAAIRGALLPKIDLVITLTTPPLLSLIGSFMKTLRGSSHFIWEMDVYPDVAVDLNYFKAKGLLDRLVGMLADFTRHHADGVLALGSCMRGRLIERGVAADKIYVAENWADGRLVYPMANPENSEVLTLMYSGNLGLAHDVDTILGVMDSLKQSDRFRFIFAGDGARRKRLEMDCHKAGINAVEFHPYSRRASLGESLAACDIGLVTQRTACLGSIVPSKIYGLLAAARPILYIGPASSTAALLIKNNGCGWQLECGDKVGLTSLLTRLAEDPLEIKRAGRCAYAAFVRNYDLPIGVARICDLVGASAEASEMQTPLLLPASGSNQVPPSKDVKYHVVHRLSK